MQKKNPLGLLTAIIAVGSGALLGAIASDTTNTTWSICFSNGVSGPVAVCEVSADGSKILRTLAVEQPKTNSVEWLESPLTIKSRQTSPNSWESESTLRGWVEPTVQIGLRPDGVVIWKKRE